MNVGELSLGFIRAAHDAQQEETGHWKDCGGGEEGETNGALEYDDPPHPEADEH